VIQIVIPYYGDPGLMIRAITSVLEQSDADWQLLVVDDAYPGTEVREWLEALDHAQVRYVRNDRQLGVSGNFQRCLELAEAEHVTFLGCDDLMLPNYVAVTSRAFAEHPDVAGVQPSVKVVDAAGETSRSLTDRVKRLIAPHPDAALALSGERLAVSLLRGNWTYFPAICWRRELVAAHTFRQDLETVLDFDLLIDLVLDGHELLLLPDEAFCYRRHSTSASSLSARATTRFAEEARLYREVAVRCRERGWTSAERAARQRVTSRLHAALLVPGALRARDRVSARALLRHATDRDTH
jgi:glycosyltransferase involved in cell wall biosynthesis